MTKLFGLFALIILCASCGNKIETSSTLTKQDIDRLRSLNLLDTNEQLYKFYSEFKKSVAGNFYTDKRLASYWLDEHDKSKNKIEFAFYKDIAKIDTVYYAGATYCPYLRITRDDSSYFKVCVDGKKKEIKDFFNDAIAKWKQNNK
jgi:ribosomal protein L31